MNKVKVGHREIARGTGNHFIIMVFQVIQVLKSRHQVSNSS